MTIRHGGGSCLLWAAGEMCCRRSGDGDRIGGVFLSSSDIGVAGAADWVEIG